MVETKEILLIAVLAILVFNLTPGFTGQAVAQAGQVCKLDSDCSAGYLCQQTTKYICQKDVVTTITQPTALPVAPKQTCIDKIKNQDETDVDCGGLKCAKCEFKKTCSVNTDCKSASCSGGVCLNANYFGYNCVDNDKSYTFCFALACNNKAAANTVCKQKGVEGGCPLWTVTDGRTVSGQAQGSRTITVQCTGNLGTFGQQ